MADLQTVENRLGKVERKAQTNKDKDAVREVSVLKKLQEALLEGTGLRKGILAADAEADDLCRQHER